VRRPYRRVGPKVLAVGLLLWAALGHAHAQSGASGAGATFDQPTENRPQTYRTTGSRIAVGRNIRIAEDEEVTDAVVVLGGSVRVDGRVQDGVVVVGGDVDLGPRADVRGDVVVVGGQLTRADGAQLHGSVSDITFGDWWRQFGGVYLPRFNFGGFGSWLGLFGALFRVSVLGIMMAFVLLVARAPVARVGRAAGAEPLRAFFLGFAAQLLFVPALIVVCIGLVVTIIGIPFVAVVVPVSLFTLFVALMLGFTAIACRAGEWVEDRLGWHGHSALVATAVGLLLIVGPTMLSRALGVAPYPLSTGAVALLVAGLIFEYVMWTIGLGATLMTGFGRWSTSPPPVPSVPDSGIVPVIS
jgi:hypothetical protein